MSVEPNIIVFRMPLNQSTDFEFDGSFGEHPPAFVQMGIANNQIIPGSVLVFTVAEGDSYRELALDQLVFAHLEENRSSQICSFTLANDDEDGPVEIWSIGLEDMNSLLPDLLAEVAKIQQGNQVAN